MQISASVKLETTPAAIEKTLGKPVQAAKTESARAIPADQLSLQRATGPVPESPARLNHPLQNSSPAVERRLQRYYGSADPAKIQAQARKMLGIEGVLLPAPHQRQANFLEFASRHFPPRPSKEDPFELPQHGPQPGMPVYALWQTYAQTDYGALMIEKVLKEAGEKPFVVRATTEGPPQGWHDFILVPENFPRNANQFRYGGQAIDPLAILHHEFEHTRFGRFEQSEAQMLQEEVHAVREVENPVRSLNGFEPRYTYTQLDPEGQPLQTVNILKPEVIHPGAWRFDPEDPGLMLPADNK
ncbi:hypothetical protein COW36_16245 [bacterium (Candidatus Blackallbacteria) CG17_big_fil_post_rev_8_21_14_2_50_48_46]|uniref:Uncharacterized protein n=1 Tax=bacterium (Candidatus Blackallbacteria) CG17_big_fil_post_rev_8_21_14_2_50_48_46 TaxID=2014261 RepID=A0A2M7G1S8_9BACT|nr:MAG: hypothetical protein COW64_16715 [bacterium (Candidatus Blackallbacteria) CG18_big_fil_WC_8_21_14_2_50_49_26]PIW15686.1 MAG: hypothetical protein COW36_16245 [bacterium (Candidatus Blackallbacteria) CG17_big_fil_post_rev_8_21_14_2_50_48_46]PIW48691.1 MAG: hypothetical protein COW20_08425 [bacterium (Candidatus Blackallbacteria) CG13_big_fil_rev_8_21_14_2_50_49_14]